MSIYEPSRVIWAVCVLGAMFTAVYLMGTKFNRRIK